MYELSQRKSELLNILFFQTNRSTNNKEADEAILQELKEREKEQAPSNSTFEDDFTEAELTFALNKLKGRKSPGPDKVHNEMLKHLGTYGRKTLLLLINLTWNNSKIPKTWRNAHIVPIHKSGKDPKEAQSYRPISLTSCLGKVGERMVNRRLYWWLESSGLLTEAQSGFRAANRTEDQLFRLVQSIQDGFQQGTATTAVFVDFQQAYDRVWRKGLLLKMQRLGVKGKMYNWIKDFLTERTMQTKVDDSISEKKVQEEGLPQGSALSCTLFLIFLNDLPQELKCEKAMYADDLALWKTHRYARQAARHLNQDLRALQEYCRKWKITINPTKTVYTTFSLSHVQTKQKLDIKVEGIQAKKDEQPTYLGVQLDPRLTLSGHVNNLKMKANKRLSLIKRLANYEWGSNMNSLRALYIGYVRSILEYNMSLQLSCSKTRQLELDRIQNNALRLISGGMRTTPIAATEILTNIEPLSMRREKAALETFERCKRMPPNHPAKKLVEEWKPINRIKHQSLMHQVTKLQTNIKLPEDREPLRKTCSVPPSCQPTPPEIRTSLKDNATKKDDIVDLKKSAEKTILSYPEDWTHTYTDGSAVKAVAKAGLGVWITYPDGTTDEVSEACGEICSNYEAENFAIQRAIQRLDQKFGDSPASTSNVVIFTDSKSILQAMETNDLDEETLQTLIIAENFKTTHSVNLKMQWIPGHTDLLGNERADKLAKQGSSKPQPPKPVPLKTTKNIIKQEYKQNWTDKWSKGMTGRKVYEHLKAPKPKDDMARLKRKDQTAIFRLRTGHVPFNFHRNRFNPEVPPLCPLCDSPYETVEHVLLECRELKDLRQLHLPDQASIDNTLYCSYHQLEKTAKFYYMACVKRAYAQRPLEITYKQTNVIWL